MIIRYSLVFSLISKVSGFCPKTPKLLIQNHLGSKPNALLSDSMCTHTSMYNRKPTKKNASKLFQSPSLPSYNELSQQKSEALRSMSEFHDGTWICENGAISSDVSGGSIMRSPPFKTSISTRLGLAVNSNGEALKLVETLSWGQNGSGSGSAGSGSEDPSQSDDTFFGRSCLLGSLADVDAVDGSYSLHESMQVGIQNLEQNASSSSSCALPESISGVDPKRTTSVIESCLVATQTERVRCFMIYGNSGMTLEDELEPADGNADADEEILNEQRLLRTVISHERKLQNDDALDDFIQGTISLNTDTSNRADQMASAMSGTSEDLGQNVKCPINMMTLSLGPWLGDIIIRDKSFNSLLPTTKEGNASNAGFGAPKKTSLPKKTNREGGFGEWVLGVQKLAMAFKYDFDCNVRQTFDYGKSMGVYEEGWPRQSAGIIYDDRMSRRIKPEDRSMYIDYDNGAYSGFIFGSVYAKAPRFLTRQRQGSALPMLTEFALFQQPEDESDADSAAGTPNDVCCSRITRLYNDNGTLKQGSTSFFVLKPMADETMVDETSAAP